MEKLSAEERLIQLESNLAHLEKLCDDLSHAMVEQGKEIQSIKLQLKRLAQTAETAELDRLKGVAEKPPHYH